MRKENLYTMTNYEYIRMITETQQAKLNNKNSIACCGNCAQWQKCNSTNNRSVNDICINHKYKQEYLVY